ncbi:MAG: class I SAM-dependent methyltransferase [Myxococcota bacterium]
MGPFDPLFLDPQRIRYEDPFVLFVDKHPGETVLDAEGGADLRRAVERYLRDRGESLGGAFPQLDRPSSGLVLFSKQKAQNGSWAALMEGGDLQRRYAARLPERIAGPIEGLEIDSDEWPHVSLRLGSLRPSSLRRTLAKHGLPLVGDRELGGQPAFRLMLHLAQLAFVHPVTKERTVVDAGPPRFAEDGDVLELLLASLARRRAVSAAVGSKGGCRIVHGSGDGCPGIEIDRYGSALVVATHAGRTSRAPAEVVVALKTLGASRIYQKKRQRKASSVQQKDLQTLAPKAPVHGELPAEGESVEVELAGHRFQWPLRLGGEWSTGVFFDQRDNWSRVAGRASGARVLNLFAYTGAFTVAAVLGGAKASTTVDAAAPALEEARRRIDQAARLAGAPSANHRVVRADVFAYLRDTDERFDLVVVDPPTYSTTSQSRWRSGGDWTELLRGLLPRLAPRTVVYCCSNDRRMGPGAFQRRLEAALHPSVFEIARSRRYPPPDDFPPAPKRGGHLKTIELALSQRSDATPSEGTGRRARRRRRSGRQ